MAEASDTHGSKTKGQVVLEYKLRKRGWSQSQLALTLGVNSGQVNHWLSGKRRPGLRWAVELERLLDIPTEYWLQAA